MSSPSDLSDLQASRLRYISKLEPSRRGFVTNYPNFQQWHTLDSTTILEPTPLNIYVHIPFCAQQCSYCYYRTVTGSRKSEMDQYVDMLCQEIALATEHFDLAKRPVQSIYFGGGTPTLIDGKSIAKITETLHKYLNIDSNNMPEFTVEAEPVTMTKAKAEVLQSLGVNRISMGVQSLADPVLKLSNRQDTEAKVVRAIEFAQSTGAVVNIDLMSGLAGDAMETWQYSVNRALEIGVESITVYKTELYANTQYFKDLRNEKITLPTDEEEIEFMRYAMETFDKANYQPWCFFTFTKDGQYQHVHATRIWEGQDYHPFGVSAFGRQGDYVFQNTNEIEKYVQILSENKLAIARGQKMTALDKIVRDILLGLKLNFLDLHYFRDSYGLCLEKLAGKAISDLKAKDYITVDEQYITLTFAGMLQGDYSGKYLARAVLDQYAC